MCVQAALFEQLKSINPQLVRRLSERLHFVVNKADMKHVCEGMDHEATQEYVASLLNSQMSLESFQMEPSQVLLISARDAYLARMVLRGQPMEASDESKFKEIAFGRAWRKKKVWHYERTFGALHSPWTCLIICHVPSRCTSRVACMVTGASRDILFREELVVPMLGFASHWTAAPNHSQQVTGLYSVDH